MAFEKQNWSRQTAADNAGQGSQGFGGMAMFTYRSTTDAIAVIAAADYFADARFELAVDDMIFVTGSDAFASYQVDTLDREAGTITIVNLGLDNAIGTANILDAAITTPKIADGNVTSDKLEDALVKHARVTMTAANWNGMYVAPFELVAAPGATEMLILHGIKIDEDYGGTVFAAGGAIHVQYDDTTLGAGPKATDTFAAATFIGFVADTHFGLTPVQTGLADATTIGQGLFLSNATAAYTGGAGTAFIVDVWYSIVDYA